jgi:predicted RNase H-like nuclease
MPILSPQAYQNLKSLVKYKSYRVYRKRHKPVEFRSYADARAYCIQHQLDHTSSWVLTTVHHCA